jgi:hypothetical protein
MSAHAAGLPVVAARLMAVQHSAPAIGQAVSDIRPRLISDSTDFGAA